MDLFAIYDCVYFLKKCGLGQYAICQAVCLVNLSVVQIYKRTSYSHGIKINCLAKFAGTHQTSVKKLQIGTKYFDVAFEVK